MRQRLTILILCGVILFLIVQLAVWAFRWKQAEQLADDYAVAALTRAGFRPAKVDRPKVPDAPPGTTALVTGTWTVPFVLRQPSPAAEESADRHPLGTPSLPAAGGDSSPSWPVPGDLAGGCKIEVVTTPSGKPWARTLWRAALQGPDGRVLVTREAPGEGQEITVAPTAVQKALAWEIRIGASLPGPAVAAGASWYPTRSVGVWGQVAVPVTPAGDVAAAAGVAFRF